MHLQHGAKEKQFLVCFVKMTHKAAKWAMKWRETQKLFSPHVA